MKKTLFIILMACTLTLPALAQRSDKRGDSKARTEKQAETMAQRLKLDDATTEWFKPIYVEMQDTLRAVKRPSQTPQTGEKSEKKRGELTELQAAQRIEDIFTAAEKEVALKRIYYKRLSEKLTQVQLLKIFAAPASAPSRQNGNASQKEQRLPVFLRLHAGDCRSIVQGNLTIRTGIHRICINTPALWTFFHFNPSR